jgi:hypothetical protein
MMMIPRQTRSRMAVGAGLLTKQVVGDADSGDDARIRREHFIKGKTIKEIARDPEVSRNTLRKVLRSGETFFEYERLVQAPPKPGRWAAELNGLLAANATKSARVQLTLIRIFEELRGGVAVTAATMRCYAGRVHTGNVRDRARRPTNAAKSHRR